MCQIDENILKNETDASISVSLEIIRPDEQVQAQLTWKNKTPIFLKTCCAAIRDYYKIAMFCRIVKGLLIEKKPEIHGKQGTNKTK